MLDNISLRNTLGKLFSMSSQFLILIGLWLFIVTLDVNSMDIILILSSIVSIFIYSIYV